MKSAPFAFEVIPADRDNPIARGMLREPASMPSGRMILFFSLVFSVAFHLMALAWRVHL